MDKKLGRGAWLSCVCAKLIPPSLKQKSQDRYGVAKRVGRGPLLPVPHLERVVYERFYLHSKSWKDQISRKYNINLSD